MKLWSSGAREASKKLNIDFSAIWHCTNHNRRTYKNFIWLKVDEYNQGFDIKNYINQNTQSKKIEQYDFDGNLIKIWDSSSQTRNDGFDCSAVIKCCKGKSSYHHGYIFKYANTNIR